MKDLLEMGGSGQSGLKGMQCSLVLPSVASQSSDQALPARQQEQGQGRF